MNQFWSLGKVEESDIEKCEILAQLHKQNNVCFCATHLRFHSLLVSAEQLDYLETMRIISFV